MTKQREYRMGGLCTCPSPLPVRKPDVAYGVPYCGHCGKLIQKLMGKKGSKKK